MRRHGHTNNEGRQTGIQSGDLRLLPLCQVVVNDMK